MSTQVAFIEHPGSWTFCERLVCWSSMFTPLVERSMCTQVVGCSTFTQLVRSSTSTQLFYLYTCVSARILWLESRLDLQSKREAEERAAPELMTDLVGLAAISGRHQSIS